MNIKLIGNNTRKTKQKPKQKKNKKHPVFNRSNNITKISVKWQNPILIPVNSNRRFRWW